MQDTDNIRRSSKHMGNPRSNACPLVVLTVLAAKVWQFGLTIGLGHIGSYVLQH